MRTGRTTSCREDSFTASKSPVKSALLLNSEGACTAPQGEFRAEPVPTDFAAGSDGSFIELVRDGSDPHKLRLLHWSGQSARLEDRIESPEKILIPPEIDPTVVEALRLPTHSASYGSTGELFLSMRESFVRYRGLSEESASRAAHFALATWFVECLPTAPCLWIGSPVESEAVLLLRLLHCLCRRSLLLTQVTAGGLCALPMYLRPTLLIGQPALSAAAHGLLRASNSRNMRIPRNGQLVDTYCAKAVYCGKHAGDTGLADCAIQITLAPARRKLPALDQESEYQIAEEFQPKLLHYRLTNYHAVRHCNFDVPQFTSPTRDLARSLGACIVDDAELQSRLISLLQEQDEEVRVERSTAPASIVIEAVLFFCHERNRGFVYAGEIASAANVILRGRGEALELKPRAVGDLLRLLGLFTRRLGSAGRGILLLDDTSRKVHRLAWSYEVRSIQDGIERCPHCAEAKNAITDRM